MCVCPQTGQVHRTPFLFLVSTTAKPALPAPRLVLWCLLVQSVSAGPSLWVSGCICDGPVCHACGMVCCDGSCLHLSSWQQRLRPCVGLCPLHNVASVVSVPFLPALRYSPLGDPDPARAACALLLGLCYFLLLSLLPPPGPLFCPAAAGLPLISSPRPCSFFGFLCPLPCLCVFWCVVCCPFLFSLLLWLLVVFLSGFVVSLPVLMLVWWAVLVASY